MSHLAFVVVFTLLLIPGALMALVPMFPTFWYLIAMSAIFGALDGFMHLSVGNFVVLFGIFLLSILVDWSAGMIGAKFGGAGWKSLLWGAVGGLIGLLLMPPFGAFAGLFLGVLGSELHRRKNGIGAVRAASGALLGSVAGIVVNFCLALLFLFLFILFAL